MDWVEFLGYFAALLVFATFWMKTMILLRGVAICSNIAFLLYSYYGGLTPVLLLHALLLPLNAYRMWEMHQLIESVKRADPANFSMEWALPHAKSLQLKQGTTLFKKGDKADKMYYLVKGEAMVVEFEVPLGDGQMIGEIGLFSQSGRRTATVVCTSDCDMLALSFDTVRQLCLQNPQFGLYLMNIIARRLVSNLERSETKGSLKAPA